jgi:uncharacterized protein
MTSPVDLEALDQFLLSDVPPDNSMGLSGLDGFLTGILVGPEQIMPSEWLPRIWGDEEPVFDSAEQAQEVLGLIMGRYNEIVQNLDGDPDDLNPVYLETKDGTAIAADWAEGFLKAIELREDAWMPLIRDKDASLLVMPILALCRDEEGEDLLSIGSETTMELFAQAPEVIPICAFGIRNFWRERNNPSRPIQHPSKVGRNDSCPCGSGRKYKRCCGAN